MTGSEVTGNSGWQTLCDGKGAELNVPDPPCDAAPQLRASELEFEHPVSGERVMFASDCDL